MRLEVTPENFVRCSPRKLEGHLHENGYVKKKNKQTFGIRRRQLFEGFFFSFFFLSCVNINLAEPSFREQIRLPVSCVPKVWLKEDYYCMKGGNWGENVTSRDSAASSRQ